LKSRKEENLERKRKIGRPEPEQFWNAPKEEEGTRLPCPLSQEPMRGKREEKEPGGRTLRRHPREEGAWTTKPISRKKREKNFSFI
jgi:hypothetical protein